MSDQSKPNILLVVLDAVRADHVSCYGYDRETTPNIDSLASDGVLYERAFSPSIWTPPVHGAIFTGEYPSHSGVYGNSLALPQDVDTLPEKLQQLGYRTFAASAGAHLREDRGYARGIDEYIVTRRIGLDRDFIRKVATDSSFAKQVSFSLTRGPDDKTLYKFDRLQKFIDDAATSGDPFFGFINCKTAHQPYNPPRPYKGTYCDGFRRRRFEFTERLAGRLGRWTQEMEGMDVEKLRRVSSNSGFGVLTGDVTMADEEWEVIKAWYDGAIRYLDERIGGLVDHLENAGVMEDTLLVVTSDHGDHFGDHGLINHIFCLYDTLLHVPLVVSPPASIDNNAAVGEQVSLVDLHPTFLEAAGGTPPDYEHAESLLPFESRRHHDFTFAEYAGFEGPIRRINRQYPSFDTAQFARTMQAVRDDQFKLIVDETGAVELYDWRNDPGEQTDLSEERPDVVSRLRETIASNLDELSAMGTFEEVGDEELQQQLRDLGYL